MIKKYITVVSFALLCVNSLAQSMAQVEILTPQDVCSPGMCTELQANYTEIKATTSYTVTPVIYQPLYSFTGGTVIPPASDDKWSSIVQLPFTFCFYGAKYDKMLVGTNGLITFNLNSANNDCPYMMGTSAIPNPNFIIRNAIYGVYQDVTILNTANPTVQNTNYYTGGEAPNRYFVINYNELPQYICGTSADLQTSQIVLYETTNIIDIHVKKRTACMSWEGGRGVIGIQNDAGTLASVPNNRNVGNWSAANESYRFIPNGDSVTSFKWFKNDVLLTATSNPLTVCPEESETYSIAVSYNNCDVAPTVISESIEVGIATPIEVGNPTDITACSENETAAFDLTSNTEIVLGTLNPLDYEINYYETHENAMSDISPITLPQNYTGFNGQIIYMRILSMNHLCPVVKTFTLEINSIPDAPIAEEVQVFTAGETLGDLEISGENILWYDEETGGNPLPNTTVLVHATTYYATQTNTITGCESFAMLPMRLGITVYDVALGMQNDPFVSLSVLPNPTKDMITVDSRNIIDSVLVYNILGQEMIIQKINSKQSQINLSNLPSGTYVMRIQSEDKSKTVRIIKN